MGYDQKQLSFVYFYFRKILNLIYILKKYINGWPAALLKRMHLFHAFGSWISAISERKLILSMLVHSFWKVKLNENEHVKSNVCITEYIILHNI